jgi:5'-deoxynucleotidase YfbR-like HD superfamily hydrolase
MVVMAGCSSIKLTYNHGDTLLYWWLDTYVDLDGDQAEWVKKDIDKLFQWHRQTQLKQYSAILTKAQRQMAGDMTQADLLADYKDVRTYTEQLVLHAVPDLADLSRSVKPEQIAQMEKKFAKNNDDYRKKFLKGDLEKRQSVRFDKSMEQFELWFGRFSGDQKAILRKASDARPMDAEIFLAERIRRQQKIVAMLRKVQQEKLSKEATQKEVTALVRDTLDRFEAPERKAFFDSYTDATSKYILTAIKIATPEQKAHAQKRMQGWIDDFNNLAAAK